jgi:O-acetyl-ADP-ribose deacetylase (regulator of RNase III)
MFTMRGDLIKLTKAGEFDVVLHGCNCYNTMGKGIAAQFKQHFPEVYAADCKTERGDPRKLGSYSRAKLPNGVIVLNCYTQFRYGPNSADYAAIREVLQKVREEFVGKKVGMPMIGAGLAGGDWKKISNLIDRYLPNATVVEWDSN